MIELIKQDLGLPDTSHRMSLRQMIPSYLIPYRVMKALASAFPRLRNCRS